MSSQNPSGAGRSHGAKNLLSVGIAIVFMIFISILLGDILIYPVVLHHIKVVQFAGPIFILAFVILSIRSFALYLKEEKAIHERTPGHKRPFLLSFGGKLFFKVLRFSGTLLFLSALFLLGIALIVFNSSLIF